VRKTCQKVVEIERVVILIKVREGSLFDCRFGEKDVGMIAVFGVNLTCFPD